MLVKPANIEVISVSHEEENRRFARQCDANLLMMMKRLHDKHISVDEEKRFIKSALDKMARDLVINDEDVDDLHGIYVDYWNEKKNDATVIEYWHKFKKEHSRYGLKNR